MNSRPKPGDGVNDCESLREWGHWQRHDSPPISVSAARIHSLRVMTHTDSIPHGGQTEDEDETLSNSQGESRSIGCFVFAVSSHSSFGRVPCARR
jgi:hypothetical protein